MKGMKRGCNCVGEIVQVTGISEQKVDSDTGIGAERERASERCSLLQITRRLLHYTHRHSHSRNTLVGSMNDFLYSYFCPLFTMFFFTCFLNEADTVFSISLFYDFLVFKSNYKNHSDYRDAVLKKDLGSTMNGTINCYSSTGYIII